MSRIPGRGSNIGRPSSRIAQPSSRLAQPGSRLAQPSSGYGQQPGTSRTTVSVVPSAGGSRIAVNTRISSAIGGRAGAPASRMSRPGISRPGTAAPGRTSYAKPSTSTGLPSAKITVTTSQSKGAIPAGKSKPAIRGKAKKESALKKFDRSVNEELKRRRDTANVLVAATTSDTNLLEAVDHLERAEAAHSFAGAVQAAEQAAATAVSPELAEEAAVAGARDFETELIDVVDEDIPGLKPIQVIGYVGITRPTKATR